MDKMGIEIITSLMLLMMCCIILTAADAVISWAVHRIRGASFRRVFGWGLISLLIPAMVFLYGAIWERNNPEIKEIDLTFKSLPEAFSGYRIVHISDIHARSFVKRDKTARKIVDMINSLDPDMIAFTGDLISLDPDEVTPLEGILRDLKAGDCITSILGNHDYCTYSGMDKQESERTLDRLIDIEEILGWDILTNENRIIKKGNDAIGVIGVENTSTSSHFPSRGDLDKAAEGTEGLFCIVLSHDPTHWEAEILDKGYPLTLSGHTHAMQFSVAGWSPSRYLFRQHKGLYTEDGCHLYVNIGLGETLIPARIGARPEITLITLKKP